MPRDDPVNEASSPPGGAVHQAQEPRELLGVQWPQVTRTRVQSQFRTGKAWWSVPIPGAQDAARVKLPARGRAHSCSGMQWLSAAGVTTDARPQVRRSTSQWASPDKVAVGHAVGRGLLVEICHLLLVQFVHVHLHVCTKRKAVRGQGRVRGLGRRGRAPGDGGTGGGTPTRLEASAGREQVGSSRHPQAGTGLGRRRARPKARGGGGRRCNG